MGIIGLLGLFLALGCFSIMSKISRIFLSILFVGSLFYWQSISAVLHGGSGPNIDELKIAMTLLSANIGGFIVATVLGLMKKSSIDAEHYQERKKSLFIFLVKWGCIYAVYSFIVQKIIDWKLGEDGIGWFFVRIWGIYGFLVILALWFVVKLNRTRKKI